MLNFSYRNFTSQKTFQNEVVDIEATDFSASVVEPENWIVQSNGEITLSANNEGEKTFQIPAQKWLRFKKPSYYSDTNSFLITASAYVSEPKTIALYINNLSKACVITPLSSGVYKFFFMVQKDSSTIKFEAGFYNTVTKIFSYSGINSVETTVDLDNFDIVDNYSTMRFSSINIYPNNNYKYFNLSTGYIYKTIGSALNDEFRINSNGSIEIRDFLEGEKQNHGGDIYIGNKKTSLSSYGLIGNDRNVFPYISIQPEQEDDKIDLSPASITVYGNKWEDDTFKSVQENLLKIKRATNKVFKYNNEFFVCGIDTNTQAKIDSYVSGSPSGTVNETVQDFTLLADYIMATEGCNSILELIEKLEDYDGDYSEDPITEPIIFKVPAMIFINSSGQSSVAYQNVVGVYASKFSDYISE